MVPVATRKQPDIVGPSLTPHKAIELLRARLDDCDRIDALQFGDPEIQKWEDTTEAILHGAFEKPNGEPHQMEG